MHIAMDCFASVVDWNTTCPLHFLYKIYNAVTGPIT